MKLHTQKPIRSSYLRSFAIGLVSLIGISASPLLNYVKPAAAQALPSAAAGQYIVYSSVANLQRAKAIAPDAFLSRLNSGEQVVQLGRFNNLNLAERRAAEFNQAGLTAQVRSVSGQFGNLPVPIPSNPPATSLPTPVGSIFTPRPSVNEPLPGVPGADFPNNSIEIVRSPQPIPQQQPILQQPIPIQSAPITSANPASPLGTQLRYFVIIPSGLVSELQRVQAIVPNAQLRSSYRGTYIEVQGYPDRNSAETLNGTVRRQGFDSRVVFF
jgi:hypothetical protein